MQGVSLLSISACSHGFDQGSVAAKGITSTNVTIGLVALAFVYASLAEGFRPHSGSKAATARGSVLNAAKTKRGIVIDPWWSHLRSPGAYAF